MAAFPQDRRERGSFKFSRSSSPFWVLMTNQISKDPTPQSTTLGVWFQSSNFVKIQSSKYYDHNSQLGNYHKNSTKYHLSAWSHDFNSFLKPQIFPYTHKHMSICASKLLYWSRCWLFMFCEIKSLFYPVRWLEYMLSQIHRNRLKLKTRVIK